MWRSIVQQDFDSFVQYNFDCNADVFSTDYDESLDSLVVIPMWALFVALSKMRTATELFRENSAHAPLWWILLNAMEMCSESKFK